MAATDLLTVAEAREAINVPPEATANDNELQRWITGVSVRVDELCGPVVQRTVTDETHDGGTHQVQLYVPYAASASSVVEYDDTTALTLTAETNATKPADAYILDAVGESGELVWLRRRSAGCDWRFEPGRRNVVVTYTAGRYASTAAVGGTFKVAAGNILRRLWQREQGAWGRASDPFDAGGMVGFFKVVDPVVHEFLGHQLRIPGSA